jgi:hypothetical protein
VQRHELAALHVEWSVRLDLPFVKAAPAQRAAASFLRERVRFLVALLGDVLLRAPARREWNDVAHGLVAVVTDEYIVGRDLVWCKRDGAV